MENAFLRGIVYFLAIVGTGSLVFTTWFMVIVIGSVREKMRLRDGEKEERENVC
jgi:hypothetical protein